MYLLPHQKNRLGVIRKFRWNQSILLAIITTGSLFSQVATSYKFLNVSLSTRSPGELQINHGRLIWKDSDADTGTYSLEYFTGAEIFKIDSAMTWFTASIDGDYIAWINPAGEVKVFNTRNWTSKIIGLTNKTDTNQTISVSQEKVAFTRKVSNGSEVVISDLSTGKEVELNEGTWRTEPVINNGQHAYVEQSAEIDPASHVKFSDGVNSYTLEKDTVALNLHPILKDGQVSWLQHDGEVSRVKLYDGDTVVTLAETMAGTIISGYDISDGIAVAAVTDTITNHSDIMLYNTETAAFDTIQDTARISGLHIDNDLVCWTSGSGATQNLMLYHVKTGMTESWGSAREPVVDDNEVAWTLGDAVSMLVPVTSEKISTGTENGWPQSRFKDNSGEKVIWGNLDNSLNARLFYNNGDTTLQLTDSVVYKDFITTDGNYAIWRHDFSSLYLYNGINAPKLIFDSLQCENMYLDGDYIGFHGFRLDAGNNVNQAWLYKISTDELTQLTQDDTNTTNNTFILVDNGMACWYRDSSNVSMLMLYDGISKKRISDSEVDNEFGFKQGKILWSESVNGVFQIMLYDMKTGTKEQITQGKNDKFYPATDGTISIWFENAPEGTILWYYNMVSGQFTKVAHYKPFVTRWMWISNGRLVWSQNGEICVYDGNVISRLTNSAPFNMNVDPYVDQEIVVWNKNNPQPNLNKTGQIIRARLSALADFDADVINGYAPLTVSFHNRSFQGVQSSLWDFGDGQTSTEINPVHIYRDPGVYSVSLTVQSPAGPASEKKINLVHVDTAFKTTSGISSIQTGTFRLAQNYPNPFSSRTVINYTVPSPAHVSLIVFDALGRKILTLKDEAQTRGAYSVSLTSKNLPSGIYYYQLMEGSVNIVTRKMIVQH